MIGFDGNLMVILWEFKGATACYRIFDWIFDGELIEFQGILDVRDRSIVLFVICDRILSNLMGT